MIHPIYPLLCLLSLGACQSHSDDDPASVELPRAEERRGDEPPTDNDRPPAETPVPIAAAPQTVIAPRTVVYHCAFTVGASGYATELYSSTDTPCPYGYKAEPGEAAPTIEILKKYAPEAPLYNESVLVKRFFHMSYGNARQHQVEIRFNPPPFGSISSCNTVKLDIKYASPNGAREKRIVFNRYVAEDNSSRWVLRREPELPSMELINQFYKQGPNEKVDVYLMCEWLPRAEDIRDGNVIVFQ